MWPYSMQTPAASAACPPYPGARKARGPRRPARLDPPARSRDGRASASRDERFPQRLEALVADPRDLLELVEGAEPAVLLAVFEDAPGERRADPVEALELRLRGLAKTYRTRRTSGCRTGCSRSGGRRATGRNDHLLPVVQRCGEVDPRLVAPARHPAGALDRRRQP